MTLTRVNLGLINIKRMLPFTFTIALFSVVAFGQDAEQNNEPAGSGQAVTRTTVLDLQSTIVGNQEQPEVIYIIPWKQIDAPAPDYAPMQDVVDGQFELLDRDEWRRTVDIKRAVNDSGVDGNIDVNLDGSNN